MKMKSKKKISLLLILIIIITSFVYLNILNNDFVWDDSYFILRWKDIRSFENVPDFFQGSVPHGHEGVYRPVRGIFYTISYHLYGTNPIGYHVQSIIIHLICTILIYFITLRITNKKPIAFMASLIFGVHPIHTEAITFITTSFDIIGVIFFLLSFYIYIGISKSTTSSKESSDESSLTIKYILSILFAFLAFFTYELTLTLPILIILYDFCFKKIKKDNLLEKSVIYLPYYLGVFVYIFIRMFVLGIVSRGTYLGGSIYFTFLTMTKAFVKYIQVTIFPVNITLNHEISKGIYSLFYGDKKIELILAQSIFDIDIIFSISLILILLVLFFVYLRKYPIVSFSIGWFFIALLPVSNIIPQPVIMTEKYAYISSFAFPLLFSYLIYHVYKHPPSIHMPKFIKSIPPKTYIRLCLVLIFILTLISFSMLTISRNTDWKDSKTLWTREIHSSPDSSFMHFNLASAYLNLDEYDMAIPEFEKAIILNPSSYDSLVDLGLTYSKIGKLDLAEEYYMKAVEIEPKSDEAYSNLATIYERQDNLDLAVEYAKKAISLDPEFYVNYHNIGNFYYAKEEYDLAIESYTKAADLEPYDSNILINLGVAYEAKEEYDLAIESYGKAINLKPDNAMVYYNLGNAYYKSGNLNYAIEAYKKTLVIDPYHKDAKTNLQYILSLGKKSRE